MFLVRNVSSTEKIQPDPGLSLKSPRTKSGTSALEVGFFSGCEVFKNHAKPC